MTWASSVRSARFSAASFSITAAFFGLFGFIFLVTQYFQTVRGYDTLQAGLATLWVDGQRVGPAYREGVQFIATGGLANSIVPYCETIDEIDDLLTLTGLRLIHERNA